MGTIVPCIGIGAGKRFYNSQYSGLDCFYYLAKLLLVG